MQSRAVNKRSQQNLLFTNFKNVQLKKLQALFEWLGNNIRSGQLSSTLTSFDRRMRVERTLVQTFASQLL